MFDAEGRTLELVPRLPTLSWCAKVPYLAKFLAMETYLPIRQVSKLNARDPNPLWLDQRTRLWISFQEIEVRSRSGPRLNSRST